jgi:hypothetical protein
MLRLGCVACAAGPGVSLTSVGVRVMTLSSPRSQLTRKPGSTLVVGPEFDLAGYEAFLWVATRNKVVRMIFISNVIPQRSR